MDNKLGVFVNYGYSNGYDYDDVTGVWFNDIKEAEIWINKCREENACFRIISYVEVTYKEYREWLDIKEKYLQLNKKFNDTSKVPMEWR